MLGVEDRTEARRVEPRTISAEEQVKPRGYVRELAHECKRGVLIYSIRVVDRFVARGNYDDDPRTGLVERNESALPKPKSVTGLFVGMTSL